MKKITHSTDDEKTLKEIDWNVMSDLGLIYRINKEILHPLGLAISRDPSTGLSERVLISVDDLIWEYDEKTVNYYENNKVDVKEKLKQMLK